MPDTTDIARAELSRRKFLKLVALTAAGVAVPQLQGWNVPMPPYEPPIIMDAPPVSRSYFLHVDDWHVFNGDSLITLFTLGADVVADANLNLCWCSSVDGKFVWWLDSFDEKRQVTSIARAQSTPFRSAGWSTVTKTPLSAFPASPALYGLGLQVPLQSWAWQDENTYVCWGLEDMGVRILGLEVNYHHA